MNLALPPGVDLREFRGLSADDQLRAIRGTKVERVFQLERDSVDSEKRTAELTIASELPYERWWGIEILSMDKKSIRSGRLKSGAPLLVGHDTSDQVGVVMEHEITADKKLRIRVRFSRSARAEEIFQDVLDGIRVNTSVGYIIHDLILVKKEGDVGTYRVTDWEPYEGSLVAVPADPTVGVGRKLGTITMKGISMNQRTETPENSGGLTEDKDVIRSILLAGESYAALGGRDLARELAMQPGATLDDFKRRMLDKIGARSGRPTSTAEPFQDPIAYGAGAREILPMPKYFTGEGAQERAYRSGMWFRAYLGRCIPKYRDERAERWIQDHGMRAMSEGALTEGGALVPDEMSPTIIDLADKYGVYRQNSDVYRMNGDTLSVPKSTGDPTAAFVSENGAISESAGTWGQVNLVTKKLGTIVRVSTELVEDSVIDVADRLAFQLGRAFAKKEDECGFLGDGSSTYGGMSGVFKLFVDGSHDASKITAATNHDTFAEIDAVDLATLMAALPEYAHEGAKWYCSQVAWSMVFWRLMSQAGGNSASDMAGNIPKAYGGYPVVTCPALPSGASTDYSALTMLAFGNLRLASKFGARRDIRIQILNEVYANYDQIGVMATERFHIVNHDCGTNSVAGPMVGLIGD